jgi:hypothetical protein
MLAGPRFDDSSMKSAREFIRLADKRKAASSGSD